MGFRYVSASNFEPREGDVWDGSSGRSLTRSVPRFLGRSSCSQIRSTRHPAALSVRPTSLSRLLLALSLSFQNSALFAGRRPWMGQPCQKQPSTNTAVRLCRNTKSGRPNTGRFLRQPVMPSARKTEARAHSVSRLPLERIVDITSDRLAFEKTSGMGGPCYRPDRPRVQTHRTSGEPEGLSLDSAGARV